MASCNKSETEEEIIIPQLPPVVIDYIPAKSKEVFVWVDTEANLSKFTTTAGIEKYMKKIKDTGFTGIYLNVKPGNGCALYKSDALPKLTKYGTYPYNVNFDYLEEFLRYGEMYNIDVYAAVDAVGYGVIKYRQGPVYEDSSFDGVTQVRMINHDPNNLEDIRNRTNAVAANVSLTHPKAQNLLITVCRELATNYPKLKGICLDVLRFEDLSYCMSDYSMKAFADYIGQSSVNRNDLITSTGGKGKLFKEWVEFRASIITSMVERVKNTIKGINPDIQFHLWSSGQWSSRFEVGQNWASVKHPTSDPSTYTANYQNLGFAHMIDAIVPGAYTSKVWEKDGDWSVQYFLKTYDDIVRGECKVINSLTVYSYITSKPLQDAMELSLKNSDGVMLFDLCHIEAQNMWDPVAETIKKYAK